MNFKSSNLQLQRKEADQREDQKTVVSDVNFNRWGISQTSKGPSIGTKNKVKPNHKEPYTKEKMPQENLMITTTISPQTSHVDSLMIDHNTCENRKSFRSRQSSSGLEASTYNLESISYCEGMENTHQSSGLWIFPEQTRRFCITTGGRKVMNDLLGGYISNSNMNQADLNFSKEEILQVYILISNELPKLI